MEQVAGRWVLQILEMKEELLCRFLSENQIPSQFSQPSQEHDDHEDRIRRNLPRQVAPVLERTGLGTH